MRIHNFKEPNFEFISDLTMEGHIEVLRLQFSYLQMIYERFHTFLSGGLKEKISQYIRTYDGYIINYIEDKFIDVWRLSTGKNVFGRNPYRDMENMIGLYYHLTKDAIMEIDMFDIPNLEIYFKDDGGYRIEEKFKEN